MLVEPLEGLLDSLLAWLVVTGFAHASSLLWEGGLEERIASRLYARLGGHALLSSLLIVYALSALLTNDGGLFLAIPLVERVASYTGLGASGVAVLASITANAGSTLTPFGNPQNIVVYLAYRPPLHDWLLYASAASASQLIAAPVAYRLARGAGNQRRGVAATHPELRISAANVAGLLVAACAAAASLLDNLPLALASAAAGYTACRAMGVKRPDYRLLALLAFFLTAPRLAAHAAPVPHEPLWAYAAIIAYSQAASNVPAAILAVEHHIDWRVVLVASNVAGLGTLIASLANLIAARLAGCNAKEYHRVALPAAVLAWLAGAAVITLLPAP